MPRTLLLADDSVTIRKVVELTFHDTDVRVVSVGSGREALSRLREVAPDIVLADVVMPGPSGYELCRAVKTSGKPVPVLLLAGTFEPFDADEAKACGADGHMTKPFDSRTLVARIESLLEPRVIPPEEPHPARSRERDREVEALFDDLAAPEPPPKAAPSPPKPAAPPPKVVVAAPPAEPPPAPVVVAPAPAPAASAPTNGERPRLTAAEIDEIVSVVVAKLSDRVVREIAWDVVPDVAEAIVKERLRELERESD